MATVAKSSLQRLKHALSVAKVKGRSSAKTREQAQALCEQHGLFVLIDEGQKQPPPQEIPLDMQYEICNKAAFGTVHALQAMLDAANQKGADESVDANDANDWDQRQQMTASESTLKERAKVTRTIMKSVDDTTRALLAMRGTCKSVAAILHPKSAHWDALLQVFRRCSEMHVRDVETAVRHVEEERLTPLRACVLVTTTGCEVCGAKRIRKVQWPFGGRICDGCLKQITTSDYRILERYLIDAGELRAHNLPFVRAELYAPRVGSYSLNFYLNRDVLRLLRSKHGSKCDFASLDAAYNYIHRERLAYERLVEDRNEYMMRAVLTAVSERLSTMSISTSAVNTDGMNVAKMQDASRTFREACKKPPSYRPHEVQEEDVKPRKKARKVSSVSKFLDKVVEQCMPYLEGSSRYKWLADLDTFEQDVVRPWIRGVIRERTDVECTKTELEWAFSRLNALVPNSDVIQPSAFAAFDGKHALRRFEEAVAGHLDSLLDRIRLIDYVPRLEESNMGRSILRFMVESPSSPVYDRRNDSQTWLTVGTTMLLALELPKGSEDSHPITEAMILDALPAVHAAFPRGIRNNAKYGTFTCPCGRQNLQSLTALVDHVRGSKNHPNMKVTTN
jgi:hypothetical protein